MAWPYDARDNTYAVNKPVPAANLNEIQDQIIAIAGAHVIDVPLSAGVAQTDGNWQHEGIAAIEEGLVAAASGQIVFEIMARVGARLDSIAIKTEDAGAGGNWSFNLYEVETNWDASTTAPNSTKLVLAEQDPLGKAAGWSVLTLNSGTSGTNNLPRIKPADKRWILRILNLQAGDHIAGIQATFSQLY